MASRPFAPSCATSTSPSSSPSVLAPRARYFRPLAVGNVSFDGGSCDVSDEKNARLERRTKTKTLLFFCFFFYEKKAKLNLFRHYKRKKAATDTHNSLSSPPPR